MHKLMSLKRMKHLEHPQTHGDLGRLTDNRGASDTRPAHWKVVSDKEYSSFPLDENTFGITTGTCLAAALAASAAAQFPEVSKNLPANLSALPGLNGSRYVGVQTVEGVGLAVEVHPAASSYVKEMCKDASGRPDSSTWTNLDEALEQVMTSACWYSCVKNGGTDPDVTHGIEFLAAVVPEKLISLRDLTSLECIYPYSWGTVINLGGVGLVTLPGLKIEPGHLAINPGPISMIANALKPYVDEYGPLSCLVLIPEGISCARQTFNPRLGVTGGISVLGTTGFVRPLSVEALVEAITTEIDVRLQSNTSLLLTFGAQGEKTARAIFGVPQKQSVQMSNFVGAAFDYAIKAGAQTILIAGHPGKLVKVAAGIMNTHSREADGRREILAAYAAQYGAPHDLIVTLMGASTTEVAIRALEEEGFSHLWSVLANQITDVLVQRAKRLHGSSVNVAAAFISQRTEVLGNSDNLEEVCATFDRGYADEE